MATASSRTLWKGAISFGLVHVPVALHSAVEDTRPKMRMLAQDSGAEVGYKKVDKATGEELAQSEVTKGIAVGTGQYVTLSKEEIREALPKTTQTIEIESFVKLSEIPPVFFNKPYYVSPINKGQKVYALLRDVLQRTGRVGVGKVVVSSKQHLAVVFPHGNALVVNLLRWDDEIRDAGALPLPGSASEMGLTERELKLGEQLVLDLAEDWHPEKFHDEFRAKIEQLVEAKRESGKVLQVESLAPDVVAGPSAEVVDLTELLKRSLKGRTPDLVENEESAAPPPSRRAAGKSPARRAPAHAANDEIERERAAAAESKSPGKARTSVPAPKKRKKGEG